MPGVLELSESSVKRGLVVIEHDEHGQPHAVEMCAVVAIARCMACRRRFRLLPSDVLPHKTYSLGVIEHLAVEHALGSKSLREAAWSLLGDRTPQHTTLHAWTEGLGAHAQGRGRETAEPFSALLSETKRRWPGIADVKPPAIDPRRHRSEPRRERLLALAILLRIAQAIPVIDRQVPLCDWRRIAIGFGLSSPLSFQTVRAHTPIGHVHSANTDARPAWIKNPTRPGPSRTRSPPGDSSRSPSSATPRSHPPPSGG